MNTTTSVAPVISASNDALRRDFPLKPFAIRHKLAGHPLLTLPRDLIEYNSDKVAMSQAPGRRPVRDALKLALYGTITTAIKPLRSSMAMRKVPRRIAVGKKANYYLKDT